MRIEGDTFFLKWVGDFEVQHMIEFHALAERIFAKHEIGYCVVDATLGRLVTLEARKRSVTWPYAERVGGAAIFGASLTARTAVTILTTLVNFVYPKATIPIKFVKTEEAARAWIDTCRREIDARRRR
jgi:hypothetical protein